MITVKAARRLPGGFLYTMKYQLYVRTTAVTRPRMEA